MAKKMGYENYIELGYYRLGRISYDKNMVEKFRKNVLEDIVPLVSDLKIENAKRMGIDDFMLYDNDVYLPGGDPKPVIDTEGIFKAAQAMYRDMGQETGAFFDMMLENEAFDVISRKTSLEEDIAPILKNISNLSSLRISMVHQLMLML